jgi:hypothetical protein
MRRLLTPLLLLSFFGAVLSAPAATGRVIKVLPQYLDLKGRASVSPTLIDRDLYQIRLREKPAERAGLQFCIQWKAAAAGDLKLRVEARGVMRDKLTAVITVEEPVQRTSRFSRWATIVFSADDYKRLETLTAWRVTLWDGDRLIGEQKSFLW